MLLGMLFTTSFFDSLNPSAIAQQLLLQAMVKKKRDIWFFILGIGGTNLALGLAIYYGIATWVSALLSVAVETYPHYVAGGALGLGALCFTLGLRSILRAKREASCRQEESAEGKQPTRLSPLSLFLLGAAFCGVELTSAFPYFGFLAVLTSYHLAFPLVFCLVMLYNCIYVLPLVCLYFGYQRLQGTAVIQRVEGALGRIAAYVVPVVLTALGGFLLCYGTSTLL